MNVRDRALVAGLVAALALVAVGVVVAPSTPPPATAAATAPPAGSSPAASSAPLATYRQGIVGRWTSVTPATARTTADRELVALVFSGLVKLGPDGNVLPDLAQSWTADKTGSTYTFTLRPDAVWQDGVPVTSADVAFTIKTMQDPGYVGPMATSWNEVKVTVLDEHRVRFDLVTPLGGFLMAARQPLLPEHLLRDVAPADLATSAFARMPIGSGPFRVVSLDSLSARLERVAPPGDATADGSAASPGTPSPDPSAAASSPAASASSAPSGSSREPLPSTSVPSSSPDIGADTSALDAIEMHFFDDPAALAASYEAGELDAAVGLTPAQAAALAGQPGSRLEAYPTATLTAVLMNQRGQSVFRKTLVRNALTKLIDRNALVSGVLLGQGERADGLIPPESWAFDAKATKKIALDAKAAATTLTRLGWRKLAGGWAAPGHSTPLQLSLIAPDRETNIITYAAAARVAKAWNAFGLKVKLEGLTPGEFAKRLQAGTYSLAAVDMNLGLDPDLYPLLASTQATTSRSNISGVQSLALDGLLAAARKPGSVAVRKKAYAALQTFLSTTDVVLPLYYRGESVVLSDAVRGPVVRELGDPGDRFWDVLTWRLANGR